MIKVLSPIYIPSRSDHNFVKAISHLPNIMLHTSNLKHDLAAL